MQLAGSWHSRTVLATGPKWEVVGLAPTELVVGRFQENCAILRELVTLRAQKSSLLGFSTHADYVLEMNMAKSSQVVATFLGNPLPPPASRRGFQEWGSGGS